jgi:hypothetical protein
LVDATIAAEVADRWVTFIENLASISGFAAFSFDSLATAMAVHVVPDPDAGSAFDSMLLELMGALKHLQQERGPKRARVDADAAAQWEADGDQLNYLQTSRRLDKLERQNGRSAVKPRPREQARSDSEQEAAHGQTSSPPAQVQQDAALAARLQDEDDEQQARQIQEDALEAAKLASTPVERLAGQKLLKAAALEAKKGQPAGEKASKANSPRRRRSPKGDWTTEGRWQAGRPGEPAPPPPPRFLGASDDPVAIMTFKEQMDKYMEEFYPSPKEEPAQKATPPMPTPHSAERPRRLDFDQQEHLPQQGAQGVDVTVSSVW